MSQVRTVNCLRPWLAVLAVAALALAVTSFETRAQDEATCPCVAGGVVKNGFAICRRAVNREIGSVAFDTIAEGIPGRRCRITNARSVRIGDLVVDPRQGFCTASVAQLSLPDLQVITERTVEESVTAAEAQACEDLILEEAETLGCPDIGQCIDP